VNALGTGTTLLVDTYDISEAVLAAVEVAGTSLGAVRIDSGDLGVVAAQVRKQLDELGATRTRIVATSDLDEHAIAALAVAPVDGYGVGTELVTGSGHPTCGFVYKLVARADDEGAMVEVAKKSPDKASVGGRKHALRRRDSSGIAEAEVIGIGARPVGDTNDRPLLVPLVAGGEVVGREPLEHARERHFRSREELPLHARQLQKGEPAIPTWHSGRADG
jgi:nicotinate phosphoribosyltransferase